MIRNTTFIILLGFLLFSFSANAQIKIGVNGGVVLSSLVRDGNLSVNKGNVGYIVGLNAKYNLGDLGWYVLSGIDYTEEGDSQQTLNFVKAPITLGLDFENGGSFFMTYDLAFQVGNDNDVQDFYKGFASILGMGFEVKISDRFGLVTRLNYGLSNLVEDPQQALNIEVKPLTLDLYLTYYLFNSSK